ncbi:integrin alpha-X-like, partial [Rhincodon typus]|uniref:integrin alpha-X-like n=1 Tax=Rhincodon typus TaxID=259920 RepID=UPI00202DB9CC
MRIAPGLSWDRVTLNTTTGNDQIQSYYHQSNWKGDMNSLVPSNNSQICKVSACHIFTFQLQQLRYRSSAVFSVTGAMTWSDPTQVRAQVALSALSLQTSGESIQAVSATLSVTTRVEIVKEFNSLPVIIGSSIGGLVLLALVALILYK